jgi:transcriptional regulator with XRE-family HTH domain
MPTIEQIRAARALLDWSQSDLAEYAGLSQTGIARIENGTNQPNTSTLEKIKAAFENANIEFLGTNGLRKKSGEIRILRGQQGFRDFMDDVYNVANTTGGLICLHNARPQNWYKWLGEEWYKNHSNRMKALGSKIDVRITSEEGNTEFIGGSFAEYRWFPKELFNEQSFYAYGNKLAFMNFSDDDVVIRVFEDSYFTEGFRILFNIAWDRVAIVPPQQKKAV